MMTKLEIVSASEMQGLYFVNPSLAEGSKHLSFKLDISLKAK